MSLYALASFVPARKSFSMYQTRAMAITKKIRKMMKMPHCGRTGSVDNSTLENVTKIPILGDIPILGQFFRSTQTRARQVELLVFVTPKLVRASDTAPMVPTGEPITWKWPGWMRRELETQPQRWALPPAATPPPAVPPGK